MRGRKKLLARLKTTRPCLRNSEVTFGSGHFRKHTLKPQELELVIASKGHETFQLLWDVAWFRAAQLSKSLGNPKSAHLDGANGITALRRSCCNQGLNKLFRISVDPQFKDPARSQPMANICKIGESRGRCLSILHG